MMCFKIGTVHWSEGLGLGPITITDQ